MAKVIKGTVEAVSLKKNYGTYGIKVDGEWYNTTKKPDDVGKGDTIQINYSVVKGRNKVAAKKVLKKGSGGDRGGAGNRPQNVDWNASVSRAIEAADLIIRNGGLKLTKTKPDANETAILSLIDKLTVKFYKEVQSKEPVDVEQEIDEDLDEDEDDTEDEDLEDEDSEDEDSVDWDDD